MKISQGDIVLIPFPFSDLSSTKTRPALIISNNSLTGDDVIVCAITSQKSSFQSLGISDKNLSKGCLPQISFIRYSKIVCLKKTLIQRVVAKLSIPKIHEVVQNIKKILE